MRSLIILLTVIGCLLSCKKDKINLKVPSSPAMRFTDLQNRLAGKNIPVVLDLDGDGHRDLVFSTWFIGDPQLPGEETQFYANGSFTTYFPINANKESPILNVGEAINATAFPTFQWFNAPYLLLAQRVELVNGTIYWEGPWKNTWHRFLPFFVLRDGKRYFGWIELSFDMAIEKTILHQAAISIEPEKAIKAVIT